MHTHARAGARGRERSAARHLDVGRAACGAPDASPNRPCGALSPRLMPFCSSCPLPLTLQALGARLHLRDQASPRTQRRARSRLVSCSERSARGVRVFYAPPKGCTGPNWPASSTLPLPTYAHAAQKSQRGRAHPRGHAYGRRTPGCGSLPGRPGAVARAKVIVIAAAADVCPSSVSRRWCTNRAAGACTGSSYAARIQGPSVAYDLVPCGSREPALTPGLPDTRTTPLKANLPRCATDPWPRTQRPGLSALSRRR